MKKVKRRNSEIVNSYSLINKANPKSEILYNFDNLIVTKDHNVIPSLTQSYLTFDSRKKENSSANKYSQFIIHHSSGGCIEKSFESHTISDSLKNFTHPSPD